jgi:Glutaminase
MAAIEGNLAVPDFAALSADFDRTYRELQPVTAGTVADYIPQLRRVDPDQLAIAVCTWTASGSRSVMPGPRSACSRCPRR